MKRRTFLWLSFAGTAGLSLLLFDCRVKNVAFMKVLAQPQTLPHFCDAQALKDIGAAYRERIAAENNSDKLIELLLVDSSGNSVSESTSSADIRFMLQNRIKQDFKDGRIVTLQGWIISVTEARQCALYTFI